MSLTALAKSLNLSSAHLQQVIQSLQRILNIDGYAVLTLEKASSTSDIEPEAFSTAV